MSRSVLRKISVILMVIVLLVARIGSVSHERFVEPIQCYLSQTAYFSASGSHPAMTLFKDKSAGGEIPCNCATTIVLPISQSLPDVSASPLFLNRLPAVYREIFIPPECCLLPVQTPVHV